MTSRTTTPPRIEPPLVAPGDIARCTNSTSPVWSVDGQHLQQGDSVVVPDTLGATLTCTDEATGRSDVVGIAPRSDPTNVLLVILDDIGVDRIGMHDVSKVNPKTPTLDALAEQGVWFRNAYASPSCSPTRASLMTGLHAMNHGLGNPLAPAERGLEPSRWTLPRAIDVVAEQDYTHAAIGKWHLTTTSEGLEQPAAFGFDHYAGNLSNMNAGRGEVYDNWARVEDGKLERSKVYATTDNVDSALRFVRKQKDNPWFVWLALNSAHLPFHWPPEELSGKEPDELNKPAKFDAMVEAADKEIGRLLDSMPKRVRERTTVIVLGDNGTATEAVRPPTKASQAKFSVYEGGIHVPLIISSPVIAKPGRMIESLAVHVDLFPTILELVGGSLSLHQQGFFDGRSLLRHLTAVDAPPHRSHVYVETFMGNTTKADRRTEWVRAVRKGRWKLVVQDDGKEELYRLTVKGGPDGPNLRDGDMTEEARLALRGLRRLLETHYQQRI